MSTMISWPMIMPTMLNLGNRFGKCLFNDHLSLGAHVVTIEVAPEAFRIGRFFFVNTEQASNGTIGHWGFWGFLK